MAVVIGPNQHGKAEVRLVHVNRDAARHVIKDLNVTSQVRGGVEASFTDGDNTRIITTDAQKNTVYGLAREHGVGSIEDFALVLARHFVSGFAWVTGGRWAVDEHTWNRISVDGKEHDHSFSKDTSERRVTVVTVVDGVEQVVSGLSDLTVLKTSGSQYTDFVQERFTTLAETDERILATSVTARWRYAGQEDGFGHALDFDAIYADVRGVMLEAFAREHSLGLQHTLHHMGKDVLEAHPEIAEIRFSMPNKHHFLVDLSPFDLDNPNTVFFAADRPYGLIEASVLRDDAAPGDWDSVPGFC